MDFRSDVEPNRETKPVHEDRSSFNAQEETIKKQIASSLCQDRLKQAELTGHWIEQKLADGNLQGAWDTAKKWYHKATGRPPPPAKRRHDGNCSNL